MNFTRRFLVFGGSLLVLGGLAGTVHAAAPPRVGILRFVGNGETDVRGAVTWLVGKQAFALIGARALEQAEETSGKPLTSKEGVKAVADELTLAAIIDGRVEVEGGMATARIAIRDPKDGSIVANEMFTVRKGGTKALVKLLVSTFWLKMGPAMEDLTGVEINQPSHHRRARARHRHS
jgi:hypothetical protein